MRPARLGSSSSISGVVCTVASIGMFNLVNCDSTSKDTTISLSRIVSLLMVDMKWAELVIVKPELPVKGDTMLATFK